MFFVFVPLVGSLIWITLVVVLLCMFLGASNLVFLLLVALVGSSNLDTFNVFASCTASCLYRFDVFCGLLGLVACFIYVTACSKSEKTSIKLFMVMALRPNT